ncbi:DUF2092 domain-containing protein [Taklimakanibacter deserti]|uniref:DUF2092 domain-containing protein n=1 Tax=Taklimakanibacter deserti TaxID=2267839 RepID=UPI0034D6971A
MSSLRITSVVLALSMITAMPAARADEAQAKQLFKAMSDYMASQQKISFNLDTTLEVVTKDDQKIAFASSGSVTLNRPDKLRATRKGGFADVELVFDGRTVSLLGKDANLYAQADIPGTIDNLVDVMRDKFHRPLSGADLVMSDVYGQLMPLATEVRDVGSGVIRGVECDHFAFRAKDVDWQIWIAQGDHPYPCRYVVTTKDVKGWPQYTVDIRDWKTGAEVAADDFAFTPPAEARKLKPGEFPDVDELPSALVNK